MYRDRTSESRRLRTGYAQAPLDAIVAEPQKPLLTCDFVWSG